MEKSEEKEMNRISVLLLIALCLECGCAPAVMKTYNVGGANGEVAFVRAANDMDIEGKKIYRILIYHGGKWYEVFRGDGWEDK